MNKNIFQPIEAFAVDNEFDSEKEFVEGFSKSIRGRKRINFNVDSEENLYDE